ncbi:MAG: hypothetical protein EA401_05930, partial [Planctomycetota bacterium]
MSSDENQLRDHAFDGIQEYDNNLPLWWQAIFYLSIVFAVIYIAWYHFGPGQIGVERLEAQLAEAQEQRLANMEELDEDILRGFLSDRSRVDNGRRLYAVHNCAQCHQADGLGSIGPSLRDDYWSWGSDMLDIYTTIRDGRN